MFRFLNGYVVNEHAQVMEISNSKDRENQPVFAGDKNGHLNQQWEIVYADELVIELTKGELNKDFGMIVEREFSIVSRMGSGACTTAGCLRVDLSGNNLVLKSRSMLKTQRFYFD